MPKRIFIVLFTCILCGCQTIYNPATEKKEFIFIDDATEIGIGRSVAATVTRENKLSKDISLQARVEAVGRKVAVVSDRANLRYEFYILDDKELNAMALPGGIVYVNKGLLGELNDEELAFVLGHEIGHVAARHAVKKIQAGMAFQLILAVAFAATSDKNQGSVSDIAKASDEIYNLIALGYSREDEYFADRLGAKYAFKAGFNPYAGINALEKISKGEGSSLKIPPYLRTHPYVNERIKALKELIPQITLTSQENCLIHNVRLKKVPIIYGKPNNELIKKAEAGEIVLGGCIIIENNPTVAYVCPVDKKVFRKER